MNEEKIINGYYQSNIKTSRNEDSVYTMKYASQQMLIDKLQQRTDKAVEYIEENKLNANKISEMLCGSEITKLLEILKGEKE